MENKKPLLSSPFVGRSDGVVFLGQDFVSEKDDVIVEYKEVSTIRKTGEGEHDFVVIKDIVPSSKTNRADYINSFTGDVGIMNVLKKVLVGGETIADVVKSGRFMSHQKGEVDLSKFPDNIVDAYKQVEAGVQTYDKLPPNLRKRGSFAAMAESMDEDDFRRYLKDEVSKVLALQKKPAKEGDK